MLIHIFIFSIWRLIHGGHFPFRFSKRMDVDALIGWNFKRLRLERNLSQEELALRLETIDQGYISQLEAGERNPTGRTIFKLASALGVPAGELFLTVNIPEEIQRRDKIGVSKSRAGRASKAKK